MQISKKSNIDEPSAKKLAPFHVGDELDFEVIDHAAEIDSLGDILKQRILDGVPFDDVLIDIMQMQRYELLQELLIKLLPLIGDSNNPALEIEVLIASFGLPLREGIPHNRIASKYGLSKAAFSERIQVTLEKFGINPPRACKQKGTHETYKLNNRRKYKI